MRQTQPLLNGTALSARQHPPPPQAPHPPPMAPPYLALPPPPPPVLFSFAGSSQNPKPFARNVGMCCWIVCSSAADRSSRAGAMSGCLLSVL